MPLKPSIGLSNTTTFHNMPTKKHNIKDTREYLILATTKEPEILIPYVSEMTGKAAAQEFKDALIAKGYSVIAFEIKGKL